MNSDPIRWVVTRGPGGQIFHVFSGPWSKLESQDIPEEQKQNYETVAMVDSEAEAWAWVDVHRTSHLP